MTEDNVSQVEPAETNVVEQTATGPSVADLQADIAGLKKQLRGLQSGSDAQIARVRQELEARIAELEAEKEDLYEEIMGRSPRDEPQDNISTRRAQRQYERQLRDQQRRMAELERERYVSSVCAKYNIPTDEIPPDALISRDAFDEHIRQVLYSRATPRPVSSAAQRQPVQEESLEDKVARKVLEILGGSVAPAARGAGKAQPKEITEILKEEGFEAANRAIVEHLIGS